MASQKIVFRADGNTEIGMGHITRLFALAEILKDHFDCYFATRFISERIRRDILSTCHKLIELPINNHESLFLGLLKGDEIVVLDNYFFDAEYQYSIKDKGCSLVVIDDLHNRRFYANAIINHAPLINQSMYQALPETKFYLGLDYALLRKPFLYLNNSARTITSIDSVFLCFGGADINDYTGRISDALTNIPQINRINIVIGNAYAHEKELRENLKSSGHQNTIIQSGLEAEEMIDIMTASAMAIVPASSILFEVIKIGMPVLSGYYIENQLDIYNGFLELKAIYGVGDLRKKPDYINLINDFIKTVDIQMTLSRQRKLFENNSTANLLNIFQALTYESSDIS